MHEPHKTRTPPAAQATIFLPPREFSADGVLDNPLGVIYRQRMNVTALRTLHQTSPFVPFTICLADGRKLFVRHNEFLSIAPSGRVAVLHHDDDTFTMIDVNLVVTVDTGVVTAGMPQSS